MIFDIIFATMIVSFSAFIVCLAAAGIKVLWDSRKGKDEIQ